MGRLETASKFTINILFMIRTRARITSFKWVDYGRFYFGYLPMLLKVNCHRPSWALLQKMA